MSLNRRQVLIAGSSVGIATLLFGCDQSEPDAEINVATTPSSEEGAAQGDVELYDGSAVEEPLGDSAIMQPELADHPLGGVDAPVTMIEYLSPTCPHCAAFHADVYPQIKEEYIDTGRITFIGRPFMRNVLDAVVFMLAEASNSYYEILGTFFETQNQWATAENPRDAIFEIAKQFGFTQERFEEILTDQEMFGALETMRDQALNDFGLTGTPTFYINGDKYEGNYTFEALSAAIDEQA